MSFKLNHSNENGTFKLKIHRNISNDEMLQISQLAANLLTCDKSNKNNTITQVIPPQNELPPIVYGPKQQTPSFNGQSKLGERPVDSINIGTYVEPHDGVRIKMVEFADLGKVSAVNALKQATGITPIGCKEIVFGNYPCPILTLETAQHILEEFKKLNIHAKIVPAFSN